MFVDISPITGHKLTAQNIIDIHDDIIEIYGGAKGVLNQGTIDHLIYLLERKNDVFKKAALSLKHIIVNHPFFDGNKRTAFEVTDILLRNEGYYIYVEEEKIQNLLLKIAKYECTAEKIEKWLIKATRALHPG
jgi:death-on-curing protein